MVVLDLAKFKTELEKARVDIIVLQNRLAFPFSTQDNKELEEEKKVLYD